MEDAERGETRKAGRCSFSGHTGRGALTCELRVVRRVSLSVIMPSAEGWLAEEGNKEKNKSRKKMHGEVMIYLFTGFPPHAFVSVSWPHLAASRISVPQPGIESGLCTLELSSRSRGLTSRPPREPQFMQFLREFLIYSKAVKMSELI